MSDANALTNEAPSPLNLPLPMVPQAVSQDAVLVVPAGTRLQDNLTNLEILPAGMCCDGDQLSKELSPQSGSVLAARYDAGTLNTIQLVLPSIAESKGWIREALHEHWQHSADRVSHRSTWLLANPHPHGLSFRIPLDWELQQLSINGQRAETFEPTRAADESTATILVVVPAGKRVQVELRATSRNLHSWAEPATYRSPELDWPSQSSRHIVWFPASVWAGQHWYSQPSARWIQRFWPQQWWNLVSLQPESHAKSNQYLPPMMMRIKRKWARYDRAIPKLLVATGGHSSCVPI